MSTVPNPALMSEIWCSRKALLASVAGQLAKTLSARAAPEHVAPCLLPQASVPEVAAPSPAKAKAKPQGLAAAVAAGMSAAAAPVTQADEYAGGPGILARHTLLPWAHLHVREAGAVAVCTCAATPPEHTGPCLQRCSRRCRSWRPWVPCSRRVRRCRCALGMFGLGLQQRMRRALGAVATPWLDRPPASSCAPAAMYTWGSGCEPPRRRGQLG